MKNTLQTLNFRFDVTSETGDNEDLKDFLWQVVDITTPTISLGETSVSIPGTSNVRSSSGTITLGDVDIEFLMDAEYKSYTNLYKWMYSSTLEVDNYEYVKDGLLMILNSTQRKFVTAYKFYNMYPTNISPLSFSYGETGAIDGVTCSATFSFMALDLLDESLNPII